MGGREPPGIIAPRPFCSGKCLSSLGGHSPAPSPLKVGSVFALAVSMSYQGVGSRSRWTGLFFCIFATLISTITINGLSASVALTWSPSPDNTVVAYKIYYGGAPGDYTNSVSVGNVTNTTLTGLVNGTTYYFAATAIDDLGSESLLSNEAFATPPLPANQPPTLNALANVTVNENASAQTVSLTGISTGSANEVQTLSVTASSSNPSLIPNPAISYSSPNATGSLTFTPVTDGFGSATITVTVNDGAASNNIVTRTFVVTVNPVNNAPTLNALSSLVINEDAPAQTVNLSGISSGAANENQTLTVTASSSNPGLIPTPPVSYTSPTATGTLSFTPVADAFGSATITVTVNDGGTSNNIVTRNFVVTVNPVNDAPTLNTLSALAINQNASAQTVSLTGISSGAANETQTLTVTASSSNPGLIPNPSVSYTSPNTTGSLSFTPAFGVTGSATITVTVNDGGTSNNIVTRTFAVTVNAVNQAPTLNALANVTVNEGIAQTINLAGITSGASNELQTLTVTATSSNPILIPAPTVSYTSPNATGSLSLTSATGISGSATITVMVNDGGSSNNIVTRTFTATVNRLPAISALTNRTIVVNTATPTIPFTISDTETTAGNLTVTATSSNPTLVPNGNLGLAGTAGNRTLVITPAADTTGVADITVRVSDGTGSSSQTFQLTVRPLPTAPANLRIAQALP